jgi:hypothetical protein
MKSYESSHREEKEHEVFLEIPILKDDVIVPQFLHPKRLPK